MLEVRTEYLEAPVGLVKCLEINKELIRECVTMPGCCCYMPLLHNHLIDSCSYVRKNTLLAAKGGCICTPLTPPESATGFSRTTNNPPSPFVKWTFRFYSEWYFFQRSLPPPPPPPTFYSCARLCSQQL